ncbi:PilZ domain-containing protein [Bacillus solimangrovi]|uniref:PilZ domain-containing protein n=1 Tax=Bacillus solimangrovi TaxID=1305675 RepID=A0A1E5LE69_9BACI|nr:PilZ domain-containing protein [Bacillus solimangrovi]OEH92385.1 hypothetical protein BFG57_16215 [Bacillus solimangrovi]
MDYIKLKKDELLSTGALYLFEGELMKVVVKNVEDYNAGDHITCSYTGVEFETQILKINDNNLYMLIPQFNEQFPNEKRKHPRISGHIPVQMKGCARSEHEQENIEGLIVDISRNGFGLTANRSLNEKNHYNIHFTDEQLPIDVQVIIRNKRQTDGEFRYGCEISSIEEKCEFLLRKYILSQQLATNMVKNK